LADSLNAQVALVVTNDASWDRIPFVYRARIGDAARCSVRPLRPGSHSSTSRPTIPRVQHFNGSTSNQRLRGIYTSVYRSLTLSGPRDPLAPRRGGQIGTIYFATTRDDTSDNDFRYRFGDARTEIVKCGSIAFSPENPSGAMASFVGSVTAGNSECGTSLNAVLQSAKRVLIFVHGFNNRFSEGAERAMTLKNALGNDTQVLLWSWPSKRDGLIGQYNYDKESVLGGTRQTFVPERGL
jgi:Alpha/beta hydrolase of unknown function (DUF900)